MNRLSEFMNESVARLCATSMCTARMVRQVKSTSYLFTVSLPRRTENGPRKSIPTYVKGGLSDLLAGLPFSVAVLSRDSSCRGNTS